MTRFGKFPDSNIRTLAEEAVSGALADAGLTAAGRRDGVLRERRRGHPHRPGDDPRPGGAAGHGPARGADGQRRERVRLGRRSRSSSRVWRSPPGQSRWRSPSEPRSSPTRTRRRRSRRSARRWTSSDRRAEAVDAAARSSRLAAPEEAERRRPDATALLHGHLRGETRALHGARAARPGRTSPRSRSRATDHGALNPNAQYRNRGHGRGGARQPRDRAAADAVDVLADRRRRGGAVVCSAEAAKRLGVDGPRPRLRLASGARPHGPASPVRRERAAKRLRAGAGIGPGDIDVIELHDAAAPAELMIYEEHRPVWRRARARPLLALGRDRARRQASPSTRAAACCRRVTRSARPAAGSSSSWPTSCAGRAGAPSGRGRADRHWPRTAAASSAATRAAMVVTVLSIGVRWRQER